MAAPTNGPPVLNGSPYIYLSRTLSQMRDDLLTMIGFPDPLTSVDSETKTLIQLRESLMRRTGKRYNAGAHFPGVDEQMNSFINEAQQTIFRTAELDKAGVAFPAEMTGDNDPTEIDYVPVFAMALGMAKAHMGAKDSKIYFDSVAKYLEDRVTRRPPNVVAMANKWLQKAQETLYYKYNILRTERWWTVPITKGNRIYDVPSISIGPLTDVTFTVAGPDTISRATGSWIADGFRVGYRIKGSGATNALNNDVQWTIATLTALIITLVAADSVVAESAGASITLSTVNYISVEFRKASEVWLEDGDRWLPLTSPLPAKLFNIPQETIPSHFELREYLEIFPAPNKAYTVYIKGHMGLLPFEVDADITTIDPEPILMQAIAWGKAHFRHPDARNWRGDMELFVAGLNAGTFSSERFIPNRDVRPAALPYPSVTFPRV